jgi:hypothetical protein
VLGLSRGTPVPVPEVIAADPPGQTAMSRRSCLPACRAQPPPGRHPGGSSLTAAHPPANQLTRGHCRAVYPPPDARPLRVLTGNLRDVRAQRPEKTVRPGHRLHRQRPIGRNAGRVAHHVRQRPFGPASRQVIGNWPGIALHRDQRFTAHALVGQLRPPGRITDLVAKRL